MHGFFLNKFVTATLTLLLLAALQEGLAQTHNSFKQLRTRTALIYTDVYKTDYERPLRKLQGGVEAAYQLNDKLKITGGLEFWNREPSPLIAVGNRYYPFGGTFVRYRALIGRNADVGFGLGYTLQLGNRMLLEAATDYYLDQREIALRLGIGFLWHKE